MARKSTIRLLVINASDNDAEAYVSAFRNAGRVARAVRVDSGEQLLQTLQNDPPDLILATDQHPEISISQCLEQTSKQKTQAPVIVITGNADENQAAMAAGASDVVGPDEPERLIFAAMRELNHLSKTRALEQLQTQLAEAEQRNSLLLSQSQDAIAYVTDGMIIGANALFSARFGYDSPDDLDCLPVVDLIAPEDHDKFKGLLKAQGSLEEGNTDLDFNGQTLAGEQFSALMQLSNARLEGEPCVQITIREQGSSATSTVSDKDPVTGLYSHHYFLAQLDSYLKQAAAGTSSSGLLFVGVDKYVELRRKLGIQHVDELLLQIARLIQQEATDARYLSHFCDDGFTLVLTDTDAASTKAFAETLCQRIADAAFTVNGQDIKCTVSIGASVIDKEVEESPAELIDQIFSSSESLRNNQGIGNHYKLFVPARVRRSLGDAADDSELDKILEEAIEDQRFVLQFTPIVSLKGARGDHYEVNTLFLNEQDEEVDAIAYLDSLDFSEVNTRVDRWILLEATKQLAANRESGHDTRLLINLSRQTLHDESLLSWLGVALKAGNLPAEALIFQFGETCLQQEKALAGKFVQQLQKLGCQLSIAEFSDSHAELLKQITPQLVIISTALTEQLQNGGDSNTVREVIANMAEQGCKAIISNVQNAASMALIWQSGVDFIQGDYLASPSRAMDYEFTDIA